jgi:hypothetical protein
MYFLSTTYEGVRGYSLSFHIRYCISVHSILIRMNNLFHYQKMSLNVIHSFNNHESYIRNRWYNCSLQTINLSLVSWTSIGKLKWHDIPLIICVTYIRIFYLNYTPYFVQIVMPFVCVLCLPEIWPKKNRICPT